MTNRYYFIFTKTDSISMPFLTLIRRFVPPYRKYMALNILFNLLSTILSLFSFAAIIPVLRILFGLTAVDVQWVDMQTVNGLQETIAALRGNLYFLLNDQIALHGASYVLLLLGLFLVVMTGFKCGAAWLANYYMVPIRTGVLRDLRQQLYDKVLSLPIGYFTETRRGDVISRMTNDVSEVEASIMSALDILFKDPIMILVYLVTLLVISWQLTLFVLLLMPVAVFLIGRIGRSLKRASTKGQEQNAEILSSIDETLLGLRVVKGFNAQHKLRSRFEIGFEKRMPSFAVAITPLCRTLRLKRRIIFSLASLWSFLLTFIAILPLILAYPTQSFKR